MAWKQGVWPRAQSMSPNIWIQSPSPRDSACHALRATSFASSRFFMNRLISCQVKLIMFVYRQRIISDWAGHLPSNVTETMAKVRGNLRRKLCRDCAMSK